jgi:hypothetical protein
MCKIPWKSLKKVVLPKQASSIACVLRAPSFIRPPSIIWGRVQFMKLPATPRSCSSDSLGSLPKCILRRWKTRSSGSPTSTQARESRRQSSGSVPPPPHTHTSGLTWIYVQPHITARYVQRVYLITPYFSERLVTGVERIPFLSYKNYRSHNHKSKQHRQFSRKYRTPTRVLCIFWRFLV